jgi:hypothetical protein
VRTGLYVGGDSSLVDLTALSGLTIVEGDLEITDMDSLTSLNGLQNVSSVGGRLQVGYNPALEDLDALGAVEEVGGLDISANPQLTSLAGLGRLARVHGIDDLPFLGVTISNNAALIAIGLPSLLEVDGPVAITNNPLLRSLAGLESLRVIRGRLGIALNEELVSLNGLDQLTSVGEATITYCRELRDLHALASLTAVESSVEVRDNEKLPTCEAEWLRARMESIGAPFFFEGTDDGGICP